MQDITTESKLALLSAPIKPPGASYQACSQAYKASVHSQSPRKYNQQKRTTLTILGNGYYSGIYVADPELYEVSSHSADMRTKP